MAEQHIGRDQINIRRSRDIYIEQQFKDEGKQPTDIVSKRRFSLGIKKSVVNYEVSFKLKDRHQILLTYETHFSKDFLWKSILNPFELPSYSILLIVDGEVKIERHNQRHTLDFDEIGFELSNENVSGKLVLGGLQGMLLPSAKGIDLWIGDHVLAHNFS